MRILLKQCFPNSLKHPALVHCAAMCWGWGPALQWSAWPGKRMARAAVSHVGDPLHQNLPQTCHGANTGALLLLLLVAAPESKNGGKEPRKSSFLVMWAEKIKRTLAAQSLKAT